MSKTFVTYRALTIIGALALGSVGPANLGAATDPSRRCDLAAAKAAQRSGVPIDIMLAMTRVETGRGTPELRPWPWTINADGTGAWYDTEEEAVAAATAHLNDGTTSFDVGCFQLNFRWHGSNFVDLADMFDPIRNADYAASFLTELHSETGEWSDAVSAYHSRTESRAETYLERIKSVLNGPTPAVEADVSAEEDPADGANLFPLLQAGGQGSAGSLVPLQLARGRLIGGGT
jgi:hypothetical protein